MAGLIETGLWETEGHRHLDPLGGSTDSTLTEEGMDGLLVALTTLDEIIRESLPSTC